MGRIVVSENVTLDGVVEDPAGAEGFGRGGWVGRIGGPGREEAATVVPEEALGAEGAARSADLRVPRGRSGRPGAAGWRTG